MEIIKNATATSDTWLIYLPVARRSGILRALHISTKEDAEALASILGDELLQKIADRLDFIKDPE